LCVLGSITSFNAVWTCNSDMGITFDSFGVHEISNFKQSILLYPCMPKQKPGKTPVIHFRQQQSLFLYGLRLQIRLYYYHNVSN